MRIDKLLYVGILSVAGRSILSNDALYAFLVASSALTVRVISTYFLQTIPAISYRMIWWNTLFGWGIGFNLGIFFVGKVEKEGAAMRDFSATIS